MKTTLELFFEEIARTQFGLQLLDVTIKFTLLLAGLLLASYLMRSVFKCSAAQRASLVWIGVLAIPIIAVTSFQSGKTQEAVWDVPVAAEEEVGLTGIDVSHFSASADLPHSGEAEPPKSQIAEVSPTVSSIIAEPSDPTPPVSAVAAVASAETQPIAWDRWVFGAWLLGALAVAFRLGLGVFALGWRTRNFTRADSGDRLSTALKQVCAEMDVRRLPVLILDENESAMPMTWGAFRQKILLPAAAEKWSDDRLSFVLRHELGHVRRRDCLAGWTMRLLLAPAWFHPLAWLLNRHSTDLRERACDDVSTRRAEEVDQYARELVSISRDNCNSLGGALAMAHPKRLEGRIRALYCENVGRSRAGLIFRSAAAAFVGLLVLPAFVFTLFQSTQLLAAPVKKDADTVYLEPDNYVEIRTTTVFHTDDRWEGIETRELEEIDKTVQGWVRKLPTIQPKKSIPVTKADLELLGKNGQAWGGHPYESDWSELEGSIPGIPRFPEGKTKKESGFGIPLNRFGETGSVRDMKVTALKDKPGKISVSFVVDYFAPVDQATTKLKVIRSEKVGPITIDNGGGLVLGVSGEGKEYQDDGGIYKLPILRGIAKRSREKLRRYKWVEVIAFRVSEDPRQASVTRSVSPRPVFRKGSKKVELRMLEFTDTGGGSNLADEKAAAAQNLVAQWGLATAGGTLIGKATPATISEMRLLPLHQGTTDFLMPKFTTGKQYTCKIVHDSNYPTEKFPHVEIRSVGLLAEVKVKELPNGKLSVELTPTIFELEPTTPEEMALAGKKEHSSRPAEFKSKGLTRTYTIENGGGIVLGTIREDVVAGQDKVPFLGDIPVLKRLFTADYENHYRRMVAFKITVSD